MALGEGVFFGENGGAAGQMVTVWSGIGAGQRRACAALNVIPRTRFWCDDHAVAGTKGA